MQRLRQLGFSLVELMVTVGIVGILAAIAIPAYRSYLITSNLSEAFNNLAAYQIKMEQSYQDNANYGTTTCAVGLPTGKYFSYSCTLANNAQTYIATATGNATQGMQAYVYTIDDANNKSTTAFPNGTVPAACWLTQTNGC